MPEMTSSAAPDTLLRGRLLWLVAAPAAAAALLFAVTAGYLWAGGADRSDLVLIIAFLIGVVVLTIVAGQAVGTVRGIDDRLTPLRAEATGARAQAEAARAELADAHAKAADARAQLAGARSETADARAEAAAALAEATGYRSAVAEARSELEALGEQLRLVEARPVPVRTSAGRQVEVFVNLSRRLQSLVHREIKLLDALENEVEDPDLLKGLFQVDHLATRIRRHAENLAVLGGAVSRRQWSRPVALTEVLRSAIAEVEHYSRVKLVPPIDGTVPGHAVASIIHLVAELIENATMFAPPQTQVLLRAQHVTAGVAVEVEDRGLGMQRDDQERVNRLLLNPEDINLDELLRDGRIGLFVVSMIARQHGVTVQLQGNIYGGTQAVVILPQHLLGSSAQEDPMPAAVPNAVPNALSQATMELAQRVPGPSRIAAPPPTWPAFTDVPTTTPALMPASPAAGRPVSTVPSPVSTVPSPVSTVPSPAPMSAAPAPAPVPAAPVPVPVPAQRSGAIEAAFAASTPPPASPAPAVEPASGVPAVGDSVAVRGNGSVTPPPLPRRHSQTHLAPQLQVGPPPPPAADDDREHDPALMASFMQGITRGEADTDPHQH
jgi:signal transduction histidine kinase